MPAFGTNMLSSPCFSLRETGVCAALSFNSCHISCHAPCLPLIYSSRLNSDGGGVIASDSHCTCRDIISYARSLPTKKTSSSVSVRTPKPSPKAYRNHLAGVLNTTRGGSLCLCIVTVPAQIQKKVLLLRTFG